MPLEKQLKNSFMERVNIEKYLVSNSDNSYSLSGELTLLFDAKKIEKKKSEIVVSKNSNVNILFSSFQGGEDILITLEEGANLHISGILKDEIETLNITVNAKKDSNFVAYFADFSLNKGSTTVLVNLNEEGANCEWHLASLSAENDRKVFDVSIMHNAKNTSATSDNYGVCKDDSRLTFSGTSEIKKHCVFSKTRQAAKIMVFDEKSRAIAKPILKIDENEIEASHGCSVGKISDEHMFYLTSRGLSEEQAKELITLGYIKPILAGFSEEEKREEITSLIEGRM